MQSPHHILDPLLHLTVVPQQCFPVEARGSGHCGVMRAGALGWCHTLQSTSRMCCELPGESGSPPPHAPLGVLACRLPWAFCHPDFLFDTNLMLLDLQVSQLDGQGAPPPPLQCWQWCCSAAQLPLKPASLSLLLEQLLRRRHWIRWAAHSALGSPRWSMWCGILAAPGAGNRASRLACSHMVGGQLQAALCAAAHAGAVPLLHER